MKWLLHRLSAIPAWLRAGRADYEAAHRRRQQAGYRARQRLVGTIWLVGLLIVALVPRAPVLALVGLTATFACFALLDDE
ncbi:MAG: hypothetical protein R3202_08550 [Candidatus Competibacterales bacterium]|nr:hypothetical protein [Candidatus Competibacterales bacterium]